MEQITPPKVIEAQYGTWKSPISAEAVAKGVTSRINMLIDGRATYWCEMRPANRGYYTIVKRDHLGKVEDVTPQDFNCRTFVHEYGGGAFTVSNGVVFASHAPDGKIYRFCTGSAPHCITDGMTSVEVDGKHCWKGTRFADMHVTSHGIIAVGETHEPGHPVRNFLALIDSETGLFKILDANYDFYSSPAVSPDGKKLAWICWNLPEMPWTCSELWTAEITHRLKSQGELDNKKRLEGDQESYFQPEWSPENTLYFVTDRDSGWWNLHRKVNGRIENVFPIEAEVAEPLWVFQRSTYAFLEHKILLTYNQQGQWRLGILNPDTKEMTPIEREGVAIQQIRAGSGFAQFLETYPTKEEALIQIEDLPGFPATVLLKKEPTFSEKYLSCPKHIAFPSSNRTAYGFYYPPKNEDYRAQENELPPLIVMIHGGPTSQAKGSFSLSKQFWTSQGFAVLDVNYGGSTGYGRDYRNLLNRNWGIVDVEDCINGALYLVSQGLADKNKLAIRGGSAGGYTTLAALAFSNTFKAGADYYGVADITALAEDTHKFESRYMDLLVGKYPEEKEIWIARSPIHAVGKITSPLIIFQGENDPIVPKNQSEMIYTALKSRNIPVELIIYPGEEHGFRQACHIIDSNQREANFYRQVFNLEAH